MKTSFSNSQGLCRVDPSAPFALAAFDGPLATVDPAEQIVKRVLQKVVSQLDALGLRALARITAKPCLWREAPPLKSTCPGYRTLQACDRVQAKVDLSFLEGRQSPSSTSCGQANQATTVISW